MASGPNWNPARGTYWVQWWNGYRWTRSTVTKRVRGWKPGDPEPVKIPPEAFAARADCDRKEREARERPVPHAGLTVGAHLKAYREAYTDRQPGSVLELEKACEVFEAWCRGAGVKTVADVTVDVCADWIKHRAGTTSKRTGDRIARATLKKERGLLSGAWGDVPTNPWRAAKIPGKKVRKVKGSWTPKQFAALIGVSAPWLRDLLTLGCYTGFRIEALMGLEWRDVHWAAHGAKGFGSIEVRPDLDKSHRGYRVPMNRVSHDLLARRFVHRKAHQAFVLTGKRGENIKISSHTDTAIRRACVRARLPNPDSANHHMRRTFGRWAVLGHLTRRPIPLYVVSKWMGHSTIAMTEEYLHIYQDESAEWMEEYTPPRQDDLPNASDGQDPVST